MVEGEDATFCGIAEVGAELHPADFDGELEPASSASVLAELEFEDALDRALLDAAEDDFATTDRQVQVWVRGRMHNLTSQSAEGQSGLH